MSEQRPDTRGENLRQVKDDMVKVITEQQERLGMIPDPGRAERYVVPLIDEQAKKTEEILSKPAPAKPQPERATRPMLSGEGESFQRSLGVATLDGRGGAQMTQGQLRQRVRPKDETTLIRERLALLAKFPEWHHRVMKAWDSGGPAHLRADKVMEVVEASFKVFGDPRR